MSLDYGRMLNDGVPHFDVAAADALLRDGGEDEWFDFWMARSGGYERLGAAALESGASVTAGEVLWLASLSAHYAQFMWFHDPERRELGQRRKVELFDRAAPLLVPPAERVEVEVDGVVIPGFLRVPPGSTGPSPCVVLIGGLESTKEEGVRFEELCLRRGMATFAFDGPGQGEVFFDLPLQPDFERYGSAVLDHLERREEIDPGRIGVLGRSLGSHYAPKLAGADYRVAACCAWGACFDMEGFDEMPEATRRGFVHVTGIDDPERGREYLQRALDLAPAAAAIQCPMLVVHGRLDRIFGMEQVEKFRAGLVNASLEIQIEDEGDHCCHNIGHVIRPRMADWMAARLGADL